MKKIIFIPTLVIIMSMSIPALSLAVTLNATSCNFSDVKAKVDSAIDGDTINIPSGTCNWGSNTLTINKNISLVGAGERSTYLSGSSTGGLITQSGTKAFRLTNFAIIGSTWGTWGPVRMNIGSTSPASGWRIDHITFDGITTGRGLVVIGKGLIDHCTFNSPGGGQAISVYGNFLANSVTPAAGGGWEWTQGTTLGTNNAVYIEDSTFNWNQNSDDAVDAYQGARLVIRKNIFHNRGIGFHGSDSGPAEGRHGVHSYEIYNNIFDVISGANMFTTINLRGGTGVIYNNTADSHYNTFVRVTNYRSCAPYTPWGACDGTNPLDENSNINGYACMDQVGTTGPKTGAVPVHQPLYLWGNTRSGSLGTAVNANNCTNETQAIQKNRDWYDSTVMPVYTPYTYPHPLQSSSPVNKIPMFPVPSVQ